MPPGTISSGRGSARREMMAGTALIHVIDRSPMRSQKSLRWNRSSRTRQEPATSVDNNPTTSALMWNSGSGLKPRSSVPSSRCDATQRAVWSSFSSPNRTTLGAPVVPDEDRMTPPAPARCGAVAPGLVTGPSSRWSSAPSWTHSSPMSAAAGRSATTTSAPVRAIAAARPPLPSRGMEGSSGATQKPAAIAPRKASVNARGSLMARPMVVTPRGRAPPSLALHRSMRPSSSRKDMILPSRACST